jgi:hypothetical protein
MLLDEPKEHEIFRRQKQGKLDVGFKATTI